MQDSVFDLWLVPAAPPEDITVWEYAAKHIKFSKKISSFPGHYDPDYNPMVTAVIHHLGPNSRVRKLVLTKGTQGGGSLSWKILSAYIADIFQCPMMVVASDEDERDEASRDITSSC